jgi:hypothetical protein
LLKHGPIYSYTEGRTLSLAAIAAACGFTQARELRDLGEVDALCADLLQPSTGPRLFVLKINAENLPRSLPPRDATFIKTRFRAHLGLATC